jgi:hypothetical protein
VKNNKLYILFFIFTLIITAGTICYGDEESIIALPGHELGDQGFSLRAGLIFPLFFHDFDGKTYPANSSIGGGGGVQWNFYLNSFLRLGLDLALAFSTDPNKKLYNMIPITAKITYVLSVSRFEFPFSFSTGINIINYQEIYKVNYIIKPGIAGYWRYDANLSFGVEISYWWTVEFSSSDNPAVAGNFLNFTPALFYHF